MRVITYSQKRRGDLKRGGDLATGSGQSGEIPTLKCFWMVSMDVRIKGNEFVLVSRSDAAQDAETGPA